MHVKDFFFLNEIIFRAMIDRVEFISKNVWKINQFFQEIFFLVIPQWHDTTWHCGEPQYET